MMLLGYCGCSMEDNGTHLGIAMTKGAETLENKVDGSELVELIIRYEPLTGINQAYYVYIPPSTSTLRPYKGEFELSVGGKEGGSTTCYQPFVYVPKAFSVTKTNAATFLTLRKNGNRIELVNVR